MKITKKTLANSGKGLYTKEQLYDAIEFGTNLSRTRGFDEGHDRGIENQMNKFINSLSPVNKPTVIRKTLRNKFFEGYSQASPHFGLQNFITNYHIEPIVDYLKSKGIKIN